MRKKICCSLSLLMVFSSLTFAQTTAPSPRSPDAISADLNHSAAQLQQVISAGLQTSQQRETAAPHALPIIRQMISLLDEIAAQQPAAKPHVDGAKMQFYVLGAIFQDPGLLSEITKTAEGMDLNAARAKAELALADYVNADDASGKIKALDQYAQALQGASADDSTLGLIAMTSLGPEPTAEIYQHMIDILKNDAQNPSAQQLATEMQGDLTQMQLQNKSLTIQGAGLDGQQFSTAKWKGKVILVDFWATWCGPCLAELPNVKRAYSEYHNQGLEIVGVSCDNDAADLRNFLQQNPDMPWPQLFDEKNPGWSSIATGFGVQSIPTMFLIDRRGILRTVNGRGNLEELIPKLLSETP